jgi:hypothetical protein
VGALRSGGELRGCCSRPTTGEMRAGEFRFFWTNAVEVGETKLYAESMPSLRDSQSTERSLPLPGGTRRLHLTRTSSQNFCSRQPIGTRSLNSVSGLNGGHRTGALRPLALGRSSWVVGLRGPAPPQADLQGVDLHVRFQPRSQPA